MPRLYSPEWVAAFNQALEGLESETAMTSSLAAPDKRFSVVQIVQTGPDGDLLVLLTVSDGRLRLEVAAAGSPPAPVADERSEVTTSLSYEDAAALSRGELDPADALGLGRLRVRGDLALLLAVQGLLSGAGGRLDALRSETTY